MKGSVRRRGATWTFYVRLPRDPLTGRQRQYSKGGFGTEREAWTACRAALVAAESGRLVSPSRRTLGAFLLEEWLPAMRTVLKPSTWASYDEYIRAYVVPVLGEARLQELSAPRLMALYRHLMERGRVKRSGGLSPKTVRNVHVILHKALADATAWRYVVENVAVHAQPPRLSRPVPAFWTPEQLRRFLVGARDDRFFGLFLLATTTGMRRGELCGLRWSDVDLNAGTAAISATRVVVDGRSEGSDGKTARSRRLLALDPVSVEALRVRWRQQAEERAFFGEAYQDSGLVFAWEDGRSVHPDVLRQRFNRLATRLGLPAIRLHDLRHSYASAALAAGVPAKVVSERLGHASVAFTLAQYTHLVPGLDRQAANVVAAHVLGPLGLPGSDPVDKSVDIEHDRGPEPGVPGL
ncbi:MAG: Tyrosine recombinase XerC-like [Mycobacterium sp.]|nr:Tyrosine recombinase XerC-like [Mycobacterium sp.]